MAATGKNTRGVHREEIVRAEWIVLAGESIVAIGSIIVVLGLVRSFSSMLKDKTESTPLLTHRRSS